MPPLASTHWNWPSAVADGGRPANIGDLGRHARVAAGAVRADKRLRRGSGLDQLADAGRQGVDDDLLVTDAKKQGPREHPGSRRECQLRCAHAESRARLNAVADAASQLARELRNLRSLLVQVLA